MARKPRLFKENMCCLIQHSAIDNDQCFYDEHDYQFFLLLVQNAVSRYKLNLHAFVLMDNYFKFLLTPTTKNGVSQLVQMISSKYSKYFNQKYKNTVSIWAGRYKSCLVESPQLILTSMRYLESLPVKTGIVDHPEQYQWSSYIDNIKNTQFSERIQIVKKRRSKSTKMDSHKAQTLNQIQEPSKELPSQEQAITIVDETPLITEHLKFQELGGNLMNRKEFYQQLFFMDHNKVDYQYFDERLQHNYPIGSDNFIEHIEDIFSVKFHQMKPGRPRKAMTPPKRNNSWLKL